MGLNLDLCHMLGLPAQIVCPRCDEPAGSFFDDWDIDCGNPNPSPGVWSFSMYCDNCEHEWVEKYVITAVTTTKGRTQ